MRRFFALFLFSVFILTYVKAQDTLPGFTAYMKANGKVLISWRNAYPAINQISIQRSADSLRNFVTLLTVPDPRIPENGFVDSKISGTKMFYRIFILFPNSKYMFTKSRRAITEPPDQPVTILKTPLKETRNLPDQPATIVKTPVKETQKPPDQPVAVVKTPVKETQKPPEPPETNPQKQVPQPAEKTPPKQVVAAVEEEKYYVLPKIDNSRIYYLMESSNLKKPSVNNPGKIKATTIEVDKVLFVKRRDSVILLLAANQVRRFSDSLVKQTKDTLYFVNADTLQIKPYIEVYREPREVYKISVNVFTAKDGNVTISLPDYNRKKYFVSFYEMDSTRVLDVKEIRDAELIIDKTNFGHSGWFRFELYEDGKLKEKNKFLIPKE